MARCSARKRESDEGNDLAESELDELDGHDDERVIFTRSEEQALGWSYGVHGEVLIYGSTIACIARGEWERSSLLEYSPLMKTDSIMTILGAWYQGNVRSQRRPWADWNRKRGNDVNE